MNGPIIIKRHPMAIIFAFFLALSLIIAVALIAYFTLNHFLASLILLITSVVVSIYLYLLDKMFWANQIVIFEDKIEYIVKKGVKQVSKMDIMLSDLVDVSVNQNGFIASILNHGTIIAHNKEADKDIKLTHVNDPNFYAQEILRLKHIYIAKIKSSTQETINEQLIEPFGLKFLSGQQDDIESSKIN